MGYRCCNHHHNHHHHHHHHHPYPNPTSNLWRFRSIRMTPLLWFRCESLPSVRLMKARIKMAIPPMTVMGGRCFFNFTVHIWKVYERLWIYNIEMMNISIYIYTCTVVFMLVSIASFLLRRCMDSKVYFRKWRVALVSPLNRVGEGDIFKLRDPPTKYPNKHSGHVGF